MKLISKISLIAFSSLLYCNTHAQSLIPIPYIGLGDPISYSSEKSYCSKVLISSPDADWSAPCARLIDGKIHWVMKKPRYTEVCTEYKDITLDDQIALERFRCSAHAMELPKSEAEWKWYLKEYLPKETFCIYPFALQELRFNISCINGEDLYPLVNELKYFVTQINDRYTESEKQETGVLSSLFWEGSGLTSSMDTLLKIATDNSITDIKTKTEWLKDEFSKLKELSNWDYYHNKILQDYI